MKSFYRELINALQSDQGDVWAETVLSGTEKGRKRLITEKEKCSCFKEAGNPGILKTDDSRIFYERISRTPHLVICGGGHVAVAVVSVGKIVGFEVTVLEDRPAFADNARKAGADTVVCDSFAGGLSQITGDSDTWFVIVTRGHRYDTECLEMILHKKYAYVGMMGSRRRVAIVKDQLENRGIPREVLDQVHTPVGLKIGAETPEEIAVSIMAEIISVKNRNGRAGGFSREILEALSKEDEEKQVLATIISRKGSAPREAGTKMLVAENGTVTGTIGGGCIESEIVQKAVLMMRRSSPDFQICKVDMTTEAAEDEGMVCGGVVEVMLETV